MDDIRPIFDRLRWRIRVWAWRLGLPALIVLALPACAHRQRIDLAETIARRCVSAVVAAPTLDEARAIAAACDQRLDAIEQEQRR